MSRRVSRRVVAQEIVLVIAAILVLIPGLFVLFTAFKTQQGYSLDKVGLPSPFTLENVETAMRNGRFGTWFINSIILSAGSVVLALAASAPAAFAFARMRFRGQGVLLALVTSLIVLPPVVLLLPLFLLLAKVGLIATHLGAIIVYAGLLTPFSVFLLTSFFRAIPTALIDAASIDGAANHTILLRIVLPLSAPAIVTLVVVNALWVWNDLLIALVLLPKDDLKTLMSGITTFGSKYNADVPVAMMGMLIASVPMLILYLIGQRWFIRGLAAGGLKG